MSSFEEGDDWNWDPWGNDPDCDPSTVPPDYLLQPSASAQSENVEVVEKMELAAPVELQPVQLVTEELPHPRASSSWETPQRVPMLPLKDGQTPPKRRRLSRKTTVDWPTPQSASPSEGACSPSVSKTNREDYNKLYNQAKWFWVKQWIDDRPQGFWKQGVGWAQKYHQARAAFTSLSTSSKQEHLKNWQRNRKGSLQPPGQELEGDNDFVQTARVACIATEFAFPDSHFENSDVRDLGLQLQALEMDSEPYKEFLDKFTSLPSVKADWDAFRAFCQHMVKETKTTELSMALELSTHSETPGRYHAHAVWSVLRGKPAPEERQPRLYFGKLSAWRFNGKTPHVTVNSRQGRQMAKGVNRGHAYLQVRKSGQLLAETNWSKGEAFVCESSWVLQWWQTKKISTVAAEAEVLENRHRVESSLKQLWFHSEKTKEMEVKKEQEKVKKKLDTQLKGYRVYPLVNKWKAQYMPGQYGKRLRFKFLVLVGDSCLGKTQYAVHLFGGKSTYYTNCQNVESPNLSGFERNVHKAIVLDEVDPVMVIKNKALFQCNVEGVRLQESRCQQSAIWRWLYFVPIIVCTNSWELGRLPHDDSDWLQKNSEVLHLREQTWLE